MKTQLGFAAIMSAVRFRRFGRKVARAAGYGSIALLFSACGIGAAPHNGLLIMGSPEAIRAWNDGQTGLVTTGKATPDKITDYHNTRAMEERERTTRETSPGFLETIFAGGAK